LERGKLFERSDDIIGEIAYSSTKERRKRIVQDGSIFCEKFLKGLERVPSFPSSKDLAILQDFKGFLFTPENM